LNAGNKFEIQATKNQKECTNKIRKAVSKGQIVLKSKAFRELKAERTREYVSISIAGTTPLMSVR